MYLIQEILVIYVIFSTKLIISPWTIIFFPFTINIHYYSLPIVLVRNSITMLNYFRKILLFIFYFILCVKHLLLSSKCDVTHMYLVDITLILRKYSSFLLLENFHTIFKSKGIIEFHLCILSLLTWFVLYLL